MYSSIVLVANKLDVWVPVVFFVMLWAVMQWSDKLPSVSSIQHFVAIVNSRGGNIIILSAATIYFFKYSMYIFMNLLDMVRDKTITQDNAFALMAIQFITTSAFGGAMGALLKTMTGESSSARSTDIRTTPGSTTIATSTFPSPEVKDSLKGNVTQVTTSIAAEKLPNTDVKTAVINADNAVINTEVPPETV